MADKKQKKGQRPQEPVTKVAEPTASNPAPESVIVKPAAEASAAPAEKKLSYDPVRAKAYRDKIRAAAEAGGHVFKERGKGTGQTVKKVSKSGKAYYYQPWSSLTKEQKDARLASARERSATDREMAQKYRDEHPELFQKEAK